MRVTEIIRQILDIIDAAEQQDEQPQATITIAHGHTHDEPEYSNTPQEVIAPLQAAFPAGDDVHHSKNPADMRTDSISLYPDWQARRS